MKCPIGGVQNFGFPSDLVLTRMWHRSRRERNNSRSSSECYRNFCLTFPENPESC
jgi:hypothetical protein